MASQTQGIQQLLAAEKRAAEKVSEARKRKLDLQTLITSTPYTLSFLDEYFHNTYFNTFPKVLEANKKLVRELFLN